MPRSITVQILLMEGESGGGAVCEKTRKNCGCGMCTDNSTQGVQVLSVCYLVPIRPITPRGISSKHTYRHASPQRDEAVHVHTPASHP